MGSILPSTSHLCVSQVLFSCSKCWRGESVVDREISDVLGEVFPVVDSSSGAWQGEDRSRVRNAAY